jgi:hypothetical protein
LKLDSKLYIEDQFMRTGLIALWANPVLNICLLPRLVSDQYLRIIIVGGGNSLAGT